MRKRTLVPSLLQSLAIFLAAFILTGTKYCNALNGLRGVSFIRKHCRAVAVLPSSSSSSSSRLHSVPDWTQSNGITNDNTGELMTVRFINTPTGKDVIAKVEPGANLLNVGDNAGVKLPRACRTGLCGSCTCEVQDPLAIATSSNPREGFATIRACSSKCFVPEGMTEMVVDVGRMRKSKKGVLQQGDSTSTSSNADDDGGAGDSSGEYSDPMARFSGNWEKEFRPSWDSPQVAGMGQVGGAADPASPGRGPSRCAKCAGSGRVGCYTCSGEGMTLMGDGSRIQCSLCVGIRTVSCGYCRGSGSLIPRKKM